MRLALALAALVVASPGKAQTSHRMTACPEWTSFESYFKTARLTSTTSSIFFTR